ncbi:MAG: dipeptidyl aminopeptidase/acylaminoacyl peptidase [Flavobacteriaceae bacterium]|jgi:dipeptidyl aminopeptidase/acylaminoacyl peptidase
MQFPQFFSLFIAIALSACTRAQDGQIVHSEPYIISPEILDKIESFAPDFRPRLDHLEFSKITYLSDGLKVIGYTAQPSANDMYPCIISNRGGNRDFGKWSEMGIAYFLGNMADWGYVVIASQYRGVDGGEGVEEFGGKDVHDVLNLVPALAQMTKADTSRIAIEGGSRGGMMTYLALRESCEFKAAAVVAGAANSFVNIEKRPSMETRVYAELIPNYYADKQAQLEARSAVFWAEEMCPTTPLLIMHGSSDWRVLPEESMEVVQRLYKNQHPVRFILFEGADHGIREFRSEMFDAIRTHFDRYVRDGEPLPDMEPHGM